MVTASVDYAQGDIDAQLQKNVDSRGVNALVGRWEEIKAVSDSTNDILNDMGVGFIKRKAATTTALKLDIRVSGQQVTYTSYFPLGITKKQEFPISGAAISIPDKDTCDWTATACCMDGRIIQRREGAKGVWYDTRAVINGHPEGAVQDKPLLVLQWVFLPCGGGSPKRSVQYFKRTGD